MCAADAQVTLSGNAGNGVFRGPYIVDSLSLSGNATLNIDRGTQPPARGCPAWWDDRPRHGRG